MTFERFNSKVGFNPLAVTVYLKNKTITKVNGKETGIIKAIRTSYYVADKLDSEEL